MIRWKRLILSFRYAFEGISYALRYDQNMRIHTFVGFCVFAAGLVYNVTPLEFWILGIMILLVLSAEMINTAIEQMVNLIRIEHSKEARIAKDVSAGMVFFTVASAVIVGLFIFLPRVF